MKRLCRLGSFVSVVLVGLVACIGDDPVGGASTDRDADLPDAHSDAESPSDGGSGTTTDNLLKQGGFESAGCLGWTSNEATLASDPDKHGGASACRVCASGSTSVWGVFQTLSGLEAGHYDARGFVRSYGDAGPSDVVLRIEVTDEDYRDKPTILVPGEPWTQLDVESSLSGGRDLSVGVMAQTAGGCFLVDDLSLTAR